MSIAQQAKRYRRKFAKRFRHLAKLGRPVYPPIKTRSVADAIARERQQAAREQASKRKKK